MKIHYLLASVSIVISMYPCTCFNPTADQLITRMRQAQTRVCLELSPNKEDLKNYDSDSFASGDALAFSYLKTVIDASSRDVCAYIINKYFFDKFLSGSILLHDLIDYCKSTYRQIPIFLNGSYSYGTQETLQINSNTKMVADGIFINPFMGFNIFDKEKSQDNMFSVIPLQSGKIGVEYPHNTSIRNGPLLWKYIFDNIVCLWSAKRNAIPLISLPLNLCDSDTYDTLSNDTMPIIISGIHDNIQDLKKACAFFNIRHSNAIISTAVNTTGCSTASTVALKVHRDVAALKNEINELS